MPNAANAGSLIVAAPSGSYGTGTPQKPLTIVSGSFASQGAGDCIQLVDGPSGTHSIRLFELAVDIQLNKVGLERTTGYLMLQRVIQVAVGACGSLSVSEMESNAIATAVAVQPVYITGSANYSQAFGTAGSAVCKWSQGLTAPPGAGVYIFDTGLGSIIGIPVIWYRAMYDIP